jgi:dTDP-4-dehydrorhamnose 3,5-epimerase
MHDIPDLVLFTPKVWGDHRGFFFESFNQKAFSEVTGFTEGFVQDNHSFSRFNTLRGLHYQIQNPQGKLVRVVAGEIYDVAVDLRRSSDTFGQWSAVILSADNKKQWWIPAGFAHGFYVLSEVAEVLYKTTDYYAPAYERTLAWDDPQLAIDWPLAAQTSPTLSSKDQAGKSLAQADVFD